jgi:hypothetical protein
VTLFDTCYNATANFYTLNEDFHTTSDKIKNISDDFHTFYEDFHTPSQDLHTAGEQFLVIVAIVLSIPNLEHRDIHKTIYILLA